jgi:hypothetical protein
MIDDLCSSRKPFEAALAKSSKNNSQVMPGASKLIPHAAASIFQILPTSGRPPQHFTRLRTEVEMSHSTLSAQAHEIF